MGGSLSENSLESAIRSDPTCLQCSGETVAHAEGVGFRVLINPRKTTQDKRMGR